MDKLIIAVGVNENATRDQNPNIPITAEEIADDVAACAEAGASVFHVHARDERTGAPILNDIDQYFRIWEAVQQRSDVLIYPTYPTVEKHERFKHVVALLENERTRLEVGPVISGSTNLPPAGFDAGAPEPGEFVLHQSWDDILYQMEICKKFDLWISHDVLEPGGMRTVISLDRMGYYSRPVLLKFFLSESRAFGLLPETRFLQAYVDMVPPGFDGEWLVLPYGCRYPTAAALWTYAITHGGHVRVGAGDNPSGPGYLPTNVDRVRQMADLAATLGREVASVAEVRERFARKR